MRYLTRILLVPILLVPILWVWPQRGITVKFLPQQELAQAGCCARRAADQSRLHDRGFASLPQQEFQCRMERLAADRSRWAVRFDLRSDDGSTLELDGHLVVDAGGVSFPTTRTATIAMTRGLHQIRLRFVQTDGAYEFYAYWTPPGEADQTAFPTQQLFVQQQPAVIVFLTRHVSLLWALCWFALTSVMRHGLRKARARSPAPRGARSHCA